MDIEKMTPLTLKPILSIMLIETGKSIEELAELTRLSCEEIKSHIEKTGRPSLLKYHYIANSLGIDGNKYLDSKINLDSF